MHHIAAHVVTCKSGQKIALLAALPLVDQFGRVRVAWQAQDACPDHRTPTPTRQTSGGIVKSTGIDVQVEAQFRSLKS